MQPSSGTTRWRLWQLVDSALPTGGFAHSGGLEALVQLNLAEGASGLREFVRDALWQAGYGALPFVRAAHERPGDIGSLDALCDAFLTNHVANRASRSQGRALIDACARIFPGEAAEVRERVRSERLCQHAAPMAGLALAALGLAERDAQAVVLQWTLRGVISASVRLGIVGPFEAQKLQAEAGPTLDAVLDACGQLGLDDVAQTAPLIEIAGMSHDALYSRLFQS